jgi:O-acetyl-ADP-ribose deacetylase (regulator of RNase III)
MGTGNLGYPHDVVARTMLAAVDQFEQMNPTTSLKEVKIVIYPQDQKCIQVKQTD